MAEEIIKSENSHKTPKGEILHPPEEINAARWIGNRILHEPSPTVEGVLALVQTAKELSDSGVNLKIQKIETEKPLAAETPILEEELGLRVLGVEIDTRHKKGTKAYDEVVHRTAEAAKPQAEISIDEQDLNRLVTEYRILTETPIETRATASAQNPNWRSEAEARRDALGIADQEILNLLNVALSMGSSNVPPGSEDIGLIKSRILELARGTNAPDVAKAIEYLNELSRPFETARAIDANQAQVEYLRGPGALKFETQKSDFVALGGDETAQISFIREYFNRAYDDTIKDESGRGLTPDKTQEGSDYYFLNFMVNNKDFLGLSERVHKEVDVAVNLFRIRHSIGNSTNPVEAAQAILGLTGKDLNFLFRDISVNDRGNVISVADFVELIDDTLRSNAARKDMKYGFEWKKIMEEVTRRSETEFSGLGDHDRKYFLRIAEYLMLDLGVQNTFFHKSAVPLFWLSNMLRPDLYMAGGDNPPEFLQKAWAARMPAYIADYFRWNIYKPNSELDKATYPSGKLIKNIVRLFPFLPLAHVANVPTAKDLAEKPITADALRRLDWTKEDIREDGKLVAIKPGYVTSPYNYFIDTLFKTKKFADIVQVSASNPFQLLTDLLKVYNDEQFLAHLSQNGRSRVLAQTTEFALEFYSPTILHLNIPLLGPFNPLMSYLLNGVAQLMPEIGPLYATPQKKAYAKAGLKTDNLPRMGSAERGEFIKTKVAPYLQNSTDRILLQQKYDKRFPILWRGVAVGKFAIDLVTGFAGGLIGGVSKTKF